MRFPARPLREVTARYVRQTRCPSDFAIVTLDFEPLPEDRVGYAFVSDLGREVLTSQDADLVGEFADALNEGIQLRLAGAPVTQACSRGTTPPAALAARLNSGVRLGGAADAPFIAVKVVLRGMRIHPVDSNPRAFRRAGWLGAQRAIELDGA